MSEKVLIGFSTRTYSPLSWLIRRLTRAKCSHAWLMAYIPFFGRYMVVEATEWGVRVIDAEIFWKRNKIVRVYQPAVDLTDALKQYGHVIGYLYDFSGLFGMALVLVVAKWFRRKIMNPLQSPHSLFCSEFVMQVMKTGQHPNTEKLRPDTISPQKEYKFLQNQGCRFLDHPSNPSVCFKMLG